MLNMKPIPGFSRYAVTTDARIFNLITRKELRTSRDVRGYRQTILVNDLGQRESIKRHRAVALAHLETPPGDLTTWVVNHKDHTPGNDWKNNLEWCTQQENVAHWWAQGKARPSISVDVLNVESGVVSTYASVGECARAVGVNRYSIQGRLDRGSECIWPEGNRYRVSGNPDNWPSAKPIPASRARAVLLRDLRTNTTVVYAKLTDVLPLVGYKLAAVWKWANDHSQPVIPGLYQIQFSNRAVPWREPEDVFEELQDGMWNKVVVRLDGGWESPVWYESAVICGTLNGIKPTALSYRLKFKGQKVFSDGKRYCYYSDLPEDQKKTIRYEIPPEGRVQRPSKATARQRAE